MMNELLERFRGLQDKLVKCNRLAPWKDWAEALADELAKHAENTDLQAVIEWAKTDNPIEGREKWDALPEYIKDQISPCPYVEVESIAYLHPKS